ncbi:MAG: Na+:solute symporter, partial [Verrucomicrobia bacterium]|nr:Na+:solute symporter [Verrucomicrobiota bacterium]
ARAAIASILAGFAAFAIVTYGMAASQGLRVLAPIATSLVVFSACSWLNRNKPVPPAVDQLVRALSGENDARVAK